MGKMKCEIGEVTNMRAQERINFMRILKRE
jgi:hypothetical protein